MLNHTEYGFSIKANLNISHKISYFLYIDDIKVYEGCKEKIASAFSTDSYKNFDLEKSIILNNSN